MTIEGPETVTHWAEKAGSAWGRGGVGWLEALKDLIGVARVRGAEVPPAPPSSA